MSKIPRALILPPTGQTTEYDAVDDGTVEAGAKVSPRFERIGTSNLVIDHHTNLCWVREIPKICPAPADAIVPNGTVQNAANAWNIAVPYVIGDLVSNPAGTYYICIVDNIGNAPPDVLFWTPTVWTDSELNLTTPAIMTWAAGIDACSDGAGNGLTYMGHGPWTAADPYGWRMPNLFELMSIAVLEDNPCKPPAATFPNWVTDEYWSSSTRKAITTKAYTVLYTTFLWVQVPDKTDSEVVLPVRSLKVQK